MNLLTLTLASMLVLLAGCTTTAPLQAPPPEATARSLCRTGRAKPGCGIRHGTVPCQYNGTCPPRGRP
jgi:predicted small lipoprotein YifL